MDRTGALERTAVATEAPGGESVGDEEPAAIAGRIGRFALLRQLGAGAMGVVYAAYDDELDRRVALKLLHAGHGGSEGRGRMLREAQAMARLSHPNVVQIYEVGVHVRRVFVAMEFVDGMTLAEWQRAATRTPAELIAVYMQAGAGLAAAHAAGLVHRDFKPDNVLVGGDGRVRVGDFGLARAQAVRDAPLDGDGPAPEIDESAMLAATMMRDLRGLLASPMTFEGAVVGTPAYMSPEQLRGADVDARSDQFSFCVALYEAVYGQRAFAGETLPALVASVRAGAVRAAPSGSSAPEWLLPLLRRGLAGSPGERFPDMPALLAELGRDVHGDPGQGAAARRRLAVLIALTIVGVSGMIVRGYLTSGVPIADRSDFVRTATIAFVTFAGGIAVFGRGLLRNRYHRAVLGLTLIASLQMVLVRAALVAGGASIGLILLVDFITSAGMFAVGGALIARWLAWVALLPALGAVVTLVAPEHAPFVAQLVYPGFVAAFLFGWTRNSWRANGPR